MKIKNLSKREKIIFLIAAGTGACALLYSLITDSIVSRARYLKQEIIAKNSELNKDTLILDGYEALKREWKDYSFLSSSADEEEAAAMISLVERIANKNSCSIASLKPRRPKKIGAYKEISLEISVDGAMSALAAFFYEVESQKEPLAIKQFTISSSSSSQDIVKSNLLISRLIAE